MSFLSSTVRVTAPATATTQAVTGIGFQPKCLIVHSVDQDSTGFGTGTRGFSVGYCDESLNQAATACFAVDGGSVDDVGRGQSEVSAFSIMTAGAQWRGLGEVISMDADGFTIDWDQTPGTSTAFHVLALGGTAITGTKFLNLRVPATGSQSYTGAGFAPDALFMSYGGLTYIGRGSNTFMSTMMATDEGSYSLAWAQRDNTSPTTQAIYHGAGRAAADPHIYGATTPISRSDFTSLDSDGFTLNHITGQANAYLHALMIQATGVKSGVTTAPTTAGTQTIDGLGFTPGAVVLMGSDQTADQADNVGDNTADISLGMGLVAGTSGKSATFMQAASPSTADVDAYQADTAYTVTDQDPETVAAQATMDSVSSDGFSLDWTTASSAYRYAWIALGEPFQAVTAVLDPTNPTPVVKP